MPLDGSFCRRSFAVDLLPSVLTDGKESIIIKKGL
jgi:hypothetical protein